MKGRWESNINVWFPFMYSQRWNCYFQNRIIMVCLSVPTIIYLWEIYIVPGSVCLFCCREIWGLIQGIYDSLTEIGTEAEQFPEKEYINGIFLAERHSLIGLIVLLQKSCRNHSGGEMDDDWRTWEQEPGLGSGTLFSLTGSQFELAVSCSLKAPVMINKKGYSKK